MERAESPRKSNIFQQAIREKATNGPDVIIIGGGMAGLSAAISAARCGEHPLVLEKFAQPGKKLLATGNGRCNLMNRNESVYAGDAAFASAVMGPDPVRYLEEFWHGLGLLLRYDAEGRGYPCTFQAATVLDVLKAELKRLEVPVQTGARVDGIRREKNGFLLRTEAGETCAAKRVILATGGAAQPKLGGNTDAFSWLESLGHTLVPPSPSLTPLRTDRKSISGLAGLRVKCRITLRTDGMDVHQETGELLFTESGVSGICVMQCSRFAVPGRSEALIDLVYDLFPDPGVLMLELKNRRQACRLEEPTALLHGLCAPKMAYAVYKQAGLPLRGEKAGELKDQQLRGIGETLRAYRIPILSREGFDRAQVMAGGVRCDEFRPENLESRLCPGLHVAGELLNVDGACGGYNLMFACLSGIRAGKIYDPWA